jgi:adenosylcobinamide-GDP ribazoletransferase
VSETTSVPGSPSGATPAPAARPRPRPLLDVAAAVGFLTLLPVGRRWPEGAPPRAVGWYAWVGWLLGLPVAAVIAAVVRLHGRAPAGGAMLVGALVIGTWAVLTRFLHWDGLADAADGLWGGRDRDHKLEIMRDSRIGSFGAAAMIFVALVQVAAVADMVSGGVVWPIVAASVLGRFAASLGAWTLPAARREGLGLTSMGRPGIYDVAVGVLAVAVIHFLRVPLPGFGADGLRLIGVTVVGLVAGFTVPRMLAKPVGGMTGDLFGATVLIVEMVVLVAGAVVS